MDLISILGAALGIGLLIFVHELGHFIAARAAGVRVEVFSLGFGQRLVGFVRNGTDYRISLFPLGGYVRVAGEDPNRREGLAEDDLYAKGFGARALFFSGGVVMNLLFALIAFPLVFRAGVEFTAPVAGTVIPGSAAWMAGIEPGDRILSVARKPMYSFENLEVEIALAGGRAEGVPITVERGEDRFSTIVHPKYSRSRGLYELGVLFPRADDPILVESVRPGSPAGEAGLRAGDRILSIDGERLSGEAANERISELDIGDDVDLVVERDGQDVPVSFEVGTVPSDVPRIGVRTALPRVIAVRDVPSVRAADLRAGDVVLRVDGEPFTGLDPSVLEGPSGELRIDLRRGETQLTVAPRLDAAGRAELADNVAFGIAEDSVVVVPQPESPATKAGMHPADTIAAIDGHRIRTWDDLTEAVHSAGVRTMELTVRRGDRELVLAVTPEYGDVAAIGFTGSLDPLRTLYRVDGIGAATKAGLVASVDLIKQLYVTLKRLFTGEVSARNLGGIVTISRVSYRAVQSGMPFFFYFLALLSINLAFINVLPIPVLDGGHLMFLLIERIKGSPVSARVMNYSQILGLVFVIALMVFVTYNDILRLL